MGVSQATTSSAGRGRGTERKTINATREARVMATTIAKRGPGRPKSLDKEKRKKIPVRAASMDMGKGKNKEGEDEEEEAEEEKQEAVEEQEMEIEEEEPETKEENGNIIGPDIRAGEMGTYEERTSEGKKEGQPREVQRKPRHTCELELAAGTESAKMLEIVEEACIAFDSFLGVRVERETAGKKKAIIAIFGNLIDMQEACDINFGTDENREHLVPVEQREHQSEEKNTVIVRDILLSTSEGAIKATLRKFGDIHSVDIQPVEL